MKSHQAPRVSGLEIQLSNGHAPCSQEAVRVGWPSRSQADRLGSDSGLQFLPPGTLGQGLSFLEPLFLTVMRQ